MLVKSQVAYLPLDQGTSVAPSGLFPSVRRRPGGSLELGMSARRSDLHMMSFIAKWRLARALHCLQTSPWWPLGSVVSKALALVWGTKVQAQAEANCHSDRFIT